MRILLRCWRWLWFVPADQYMSAGWLAAIHNRQKPSRTADPTPMPKASVWQRIGWLVNIGQKAKRA